MTRRSSRHGVPGAVTRTGRILAGTVLGVLVTITGCGSATPAPNSPAEVSAVPDDQVRVELVRSGGFTGLRRCASVDTASLPSAQAREVRAALDGVDLRALAGAPTNPRAPALEMTVVRGAERTVLHLDETTVPALLRPLVQLLDQRAQPC